MTTTRHADELEELDDETRKHVLKLLSELETQLKARRDPGIATKGARQGGSVKQSIGELKDLFGGDEVEGDPVGDDEEWIARTRSSADGDVPEPEDGEDAEGWV